MDIWNYGDVFYKIKTAFRFLSFTSQESTDTSAPPQNCDHCYASLNKCKFELDEIRIKLWWYDAFFQGILPLVTIVLITYLIYRRYFAAVELKHSRQSQVAQRPTFPVAPQILQTTIPDHPLETCDVACICQSRTTKHQLESVLIPLLNEEVPNLTSKTIRTISVIVEDVHLIPKARVYLVFIDWNARGVIIESPDDPLQGCLGRCTVEAVESRGGHLFVIYIGHRGSGNLATLYDERIQTTRTNPHLRALVASDRFFSVYRRFNEVQLETLSRELKDILE